MLKATHKTDSRGVRGTRQILDGKCSTVTLQRGLDKERSVLLGAMFNNSPQSPTQLPFSWIPDMSITTAIPTDPRSSVTQNEETVVLTYDS